jgi:metal-responsive CopG/Arc/MetJ family transcriptional regulator
MVERRKTRMPKLVIVNISLPDDLDAYFGVVCERAHLSRSEFFREAGKFYIEKRLKKAIEAYEKVKKEGAE